MKHFKLHTVIENKSRHSIEVVWENAQDLEHVATLHQRTNCGFRLLHHERAADSKYAYDTLVYSASRKLAGVMPINSFGFRKIVGHYNIHQLECISILGWTSFLNSQLISTGNKDFPTLMRDEVTVELPVIFKPLTGWIKRSLQRHARLQCEEDEPFRARREELSQRGIHLPFRLFNQSEFFKMARSTKAP